MLRRDDFLPPSLPRIATATARSPVAALLGPRLRRIAAARMEMPSWGMSRSGRDSYPVHPRISVLSVFDCPELAKHIRTP